METTQMDDRTQRSLSERFLRDLLCGTNGCDTLSSNGPLGSGMGRGEKLMTEINSTLSKVATPKPLSDREVLQQLDNAIGHVPLAPKTVEPKSPPPFPLRALTQKGQAPFIPHDLADW
jgi:hypothetical protein